MELKTPVVYGIFLSISFVIFLLYIISAARYLTDHEENTCAMTYMFEYPQYVRISLSNKNEDVSEDYLFPRFRLYAYGEGFVTERLRRMHFSGIPVLFIPGNAGSHEQVRSLASVSLRKSLKSRTPFHFDYFSISFGKEYSALYGGVLEEETKFVAKCIQKILSLYQDNVKNVILIGHSMGGIIAKGALLLAPQINTKVASILITLATPYNPSFYPDYTFLNYYKKLSDSIEYLQENGTTVISIGGGPRDIIVPSSQIIDEHADLNVLTTNIPGVWRTTDHLCILWCKQLILKVVRSLFDCVDISQKPPAIFESHEVRMKAFHWHMVQRFSTKKKLPSTLYPQKVQFLIDDSEWIEDIRRQYVWSSKNYTLQNKSKKIKTVYLMIRLNAPIDTISIDAVHLKNLDWIFACSASNVREQSRVCLSGWSLTNLTRVIPGLTRKPWKSSVDIDLNEIKSLGASHVVMRIPIQTYNNYNHDSEEEDEDDDDQIIQVDAYLRSTRHKFFSEIQNPWFSERGMLRYYVTLDGITDGVSVGFKKSNCNDNSYSHYAMVELLEPWIPGAAQIFHFSENDDTPKALKLQTVHSQRLQIMKSQNAQLRFTIDSACSHEISVERKNIIEIIVCMVRDRWRFIYPIIVGLLLLSIAQQFDSQHNDKISITAIIIVTGILCLRFNLLIEFCVSVFILHIMAIGICCSVVFFGSVAHNIAVRFLARAITFSTTWSDWLLGGLVNQLPIVTAGVLLSIIPATCGALAMLLSIFIHYLRLTQMYDDFLEELLLASMRHFNLLKKREKNNESCNITRQNMFNQVLLFLFWSFAALPAIPSALVWAKNFRFSSRLETEDPIFMYSWIIMVACGTSGLVKISTTISNSYKSKLLTALLRCLGWIALTMSTLSNAAYYYWCFPPTLAVIVVLISIYSLQL